MIKLKDIYIVISILLLLVNVQTSVLAGQNEKEQKILQTYVNCTIIIKDCSAAQKTLYDMSRQYDGKLTNFNFNQESNSGNASILINPDTVSSFVKDLKVMGQIESTNYSSSDYTSSYYECKRKLEAYEKFYDLYPEAINKMDLSTEDKRLLQGEFSQSISSQITSLKSSLQSYAQYNNYTTVSIQLRYSGSSNTCQQGQGDTTEIKQLKIIDEKPALNLWGVLPLSILCIINLILIYYLFRKVKKDPNFS